MAKQRKDRIPPSAQPYRSLVLRAIKSEVDQKAGQLIEEVLKPKHVKRPPKGSHANYIVAITTKWHGDNCYFIATYRCPAPNAIASSFEAKFARMTYVGNGLFNLSFMRHTGKWVELYDDLSVDKCLEAIRDDPFFLP